MAKSDYYETLGVGRDADKAAIKSAYKRLAMKHHPDRNPGDNQAEEKFKKVQEAYTVLSNVEQKAAYDRFGHRAFESGGGNGQPAQDFSHFFDNIFGNFFGADSRRADGGGARHIIDLKISFEESICGCKKDIRVNLPEICADCDGSGARAGSKPIPCGQCGGSGQIHLQRGFLAIQQTCPQCRGRGIKIGAPCKTCGGNGQQHCTRRLSASIPAGISDGEIMRVNIGRLRGELLLRISVSAHPLFQRDGDDLHLVIPVSVAAAALGGKIYAPLPGRGKLEIVIPPETQSGKTLRIRGKGAPNLRTQQRGDLLCHVMVETPVNLSEKQKSLLREFENTLKKEKHRPKEKSWLEKAKSLFSDFS